MQIDHVVCPFCGCDCDDISVIVEENRIVRVGNACAKGQASFFAKSEITDAPAARIEGTPAPFEEAVDLAARLLVQARHPLIYGACGISYEAQREASALAQAVGGCIDGCCHSYAIALQTVGLQSCTLGEVKNRADLIIYWGVDPVELHPRHMARYSAHSEGMFLPGGRRDRTLVLVNELKTAGAADADHFLQISSARYFEALWILQSILDGANPDSLNCEPSFLGQLSQLAELMRHCVFGALFVGNELTEAHGGHFNAIAASQLVRAANEHAKFALLPMACHGNCAGLENALVAATGFPSAVDFSLGYPRYNPDENAWPRLLERGDVDAVLLATTDPLAALSDAALKQLENIPLIAIDSQDCAAMKKAKVAFLSSAEGIHVEGTLFRMDNTPLRMTRLLSSPYSSSEEILKCLLSRAKELRGC